MPNGGEGRPVKFDKSPFLKKSYKRPPIVTPVEVEVQLQLWSICQQILKKDLNSERALGL